MFIVEGNPLFPISNFYKGELPLIEEMKEFSGIGETRRTLQYVTLFVIALFWSMKGIAPLPYTASASWDGALMFCSFCFICGGPLFPIPMP